MSGFRNPLSFALALALTSGFPALAQFKEVGAAPVSAPVARERVRTLLDKLEPDNRDRTVATISSLLTWYRDLIDEELVAAWHKDGRSNLPEAIEALADAPVARAIVEFSWRTQRADAFIPAYAPMLGHLMARYPDSAGPFLGDLLGAAPPDLSQPEAAAVCRILLDMPDLGTWRKSALRILPQYRRTAQSLLNADVLGPDLEKGYTARRWLADLRKVDPAFTVPEDTEAAARPRLAQPPRLTPPARQAANFGPDTDAPPGSRPTLRRKSVETAPPDAPALSGRSPAPQGDSTDAVIAATRRAAAPTFAGLPDLVVERVSTRYKGSRKGDKWRSVDTATVALAVAAGQETFRGVGVAGRVSGTRDNTGTSSSGEFTSIGAILSPSAAGAFTPRGSTLVGDRPALLFDFSIEQARSAWTLNANGTQFMPAYSGSIAVDRETNRVLRVDYHAVDLPGDFPLDRLSVSLEYGFVNLNGRSYLVPQRSEVASCTTGKSDCSRNVTEFRNYRADLPRQ